MILSAEQRIAEAGFAVPARITAYLAGEHLPHDSHAHCLPIVYPATAETVCELQESGAGEVARAVAVAREAFSTGPWPRLAAAERQHILRRVHEAVLLHRDELAFLECLAAGLPLSHLRDRQLPRAAENFAFFAEVLGQLAGESFDQMSGFVTTVTRGPAGVCALLAPWNAPLALASMQIASCIAFGNTCVLKPSEYTPLAVSRLVAIMEAAGVPPGVVNVVNGRGPVTGAALCAHDGIDRIAFTGRSATARDVMASAATNLTPVQFQLSGKSANIVFEDADLERALDATLVNAFSNSGQICVAGSRILVQRAVAEDFIAALGERTAALRVGDPMAAATEIGPLAFRAHFERVCAYAQSAREQGAQLLAGGAPAADLAPGYFFAPTLARVADNSLRICQEEIFGPFATVQVFENDEDAWSIANDSRYGLLAYVFSESLERSLAAQQHLDCGTVWINTPLARDLRAPFGGVKNSGIGRDGPRQCADFFTETKSTIVARGRAPIRRMGLPEGE